MDDISRIDIDDVHDDTLSIKLIDIICKRFPKICEVAQNSQLGIEAFATNQALRDIWEANRHKEQAEPQEALQMAQVFADQQRFDLAVAMTQQIPSLIRPTSAGVSPLLVEAMEKQASYLTELASQVHQNAIFIRHQAETTAKLAEHLATLHHQIPE